MAKLKKAKAEYFFSRDGWLYVTEVSKELGKALRETQRDDLHQACFSIYDWALESEDALDGGGLLSAMRAARLENPAATAQACERVAALADSDAQFGLGMGFATGDGVPVDKQKAFHWLSQAAGKRHPGAQFQLGMIYARGDGVPKDDVEAYARLSVAVALGHREAAGNLAKMEAILTPSARAQGKQLAAKIMDSLNGPAKGRA